MSATKSPNGTFLLQGDQLATLKNLGRICGVRVKKAAHLCAEDPDLLSLMIVNRFCHKFSRLEHEKGKLRKALNKRWQQKNQGCFFAPRKMTGLIVEAYVQRYAHRTLRSLNNFLNGRVGEISVSNELGGDEILAHLVLYAANAEKSSFVANHVSGSDVWRCLCKIIREEKRRAVREGNLAVSRDKAMSFLASVFLAQLVGTYRVEPHTAFLDFIIALHDTIVSAS